MVGPQTRPVTFSQPGIPCSKGDQVVVIIITTVSRPGVSVRTGRSAMFTRNVMYIVIGEVVSPAELSNLDLTILPSGEGLSVGRRPWFISY